MAVRTAPTVGRDIDSATLDAAIDEGASLIIVMGDAGIGKTRFVSDALDRQRALGRLTLLGSCLPMSRPLPLHPIAEAVRSLSRLDGGRVLAQALAACAPYVPAELSRLVPSLALGRTGPSELATSSGSWERERLFSAVAETLQAVTSSGELLIAVEDLHWADQTSLDMLTYLQAHLPGSGARLLVTCRLDEPLAPYVVQWLGNARRLLPAEICLRGLTREAVHSFVGQLVGAPAPPEFAEDLFARTAGNPFFIEQVVASARRPLEAAGAGPVPAALAQLLAARVEDISLPARDVLTALGIVRRPVPEPLLLAITGMDADLARQALHELRESRLLAEVVADGYAPRHALLAEAVALALLPGERRAWHARIARALEADSDPVAAAEVASHWHRAGSPVDELRATARAATAAASVCAYSEAASFGRRAIELSDQLPHGVHQAKPDTRQLYLQTLAAIEASGRQEEAAQLAERAFRRYAGDNDIAAAAEIRTIAAYHRRIRDHPAALQGLAEAIQLFARLPPSREHAYALLQRGRILRLSGDTRGSVEPLQRALEMVAHVDAVDIEVECLANLGLARCRAGDVREGRSLMSRGHDLLPRLLDEGVDLAPALVLALWSSDVDLKIGRLETAERTAVEGLAWARQSGRDHTFTAACVAGKAVEAMLERGKVDDARLLLAPRTAATPHESDWVWHSCRAVTDIRLGDLRGAHARMESVVPATTLAVPEMVREFAESFAEVAVWTGRPAEVGPAILHAAGRCEGTEDELFWGELLVLGARAAADMAERARARRDPPALAHAMDALRAVETVAERMQQRPFTDHAFGVRIPADRAQWVAERQRARGLVEPRPWLDCAQLWEEQGRPHRAAYAWWRGAEACLSAKDSRRGADSLHRAANLGVGMVPLLADVTSLARRARIELPERLLATTPPSRRVPGDASGSPGGTAADDGAGDPYGLTDRERAVLRLVAGGRTNAQIGAELFISHKTASVHVTNILRKLDVDNRTQAAATAERAGLLGGVTTDHLYVD